MRNINIPMSTNNKLPQLSKTQKKIRKLKRNPKLFIIDSRAYLQTRKTLYLTRAKLGSFALVIIASLMIVFYYTILASPRYVSHIQFVVKQASSNELPIAGLAAIGASSPSMRDALILKEYIISSEMAAALNKKINLKEHYESDKWDFISRLHLNSTQEEYVAYYKKHIDVIYDEMSEIIKIEVQSFDKNYSLTVANTLMEISEEFINQLGQKMAQQQIDFAKKEVNRAYAIVKNNQTSLVEFQNKHQLFNPEFQSTALLEAINQLEAQVISHQTELKSLQAYMQPNSSEIKAKEYKLSALKQQLAQERKKLINQDNESLNKVNLDFKEIELNGLLGIDLYKSALTALELIRTDSLTKLKHLLIVEYPKVAEEDTYPRRLYSIFTWFAFLLIAYFIGRLIIAVIKDHRE